jgi:hypothetical protein
VFTDYDLKCTTYSRLNENQQVVKEGSAKMVVCFQRGIIKEKNTKRCPEKINITL